MKFESPIQTPRRFVEKAWIDYNGHMNVAFYVLAFDQAVDHAWDLIGVGPAYVEAKNASTFALQSQVHYLRELKLGAPLEITFQMLDCDSKRMHYFLEMHHAEETYLAATEERISVHVDMTERRSAPFPDDVMANIESLMASHRSMPIPPQVGSQIKIRR
jgi:acyl-CoA thioester hydrolase